MVGSECLPNWQYQGIHRHFIAYSTYVGDWMLDCGEMKIQLLLLLCLMEGMVITKQEFHLFTICIPVFLMSDSIYMYPIPHGLVK